jgi:hypothetical protein
VTFIKDTSNESEQTVIPLNWKMSQMKGEIRMCKSKNCISSKEDLEISSPDEGKQYGKIPTTLPTCFRKNQPKDDTQYSASDLKMLNADNKSESESEVILTKNSGKEKDQEGGSSETVNRQTETSHSEASHLRMPGRERKIPVTRTNDFLW